eukprot:6541487-Prymnesium_polylepis.1
MSVVRASSSLVSPSASPSVISFKNAIKATFVKAGQAAQGDGTFIKYTSHARHMISKDLLLQGKPEDSSALSLATMCAVDVITYEEDEEPETEDEDEENDK